MVAVAQLVEPRIVIPVVAGSIPVSHPISLPFNLFPPRRFSNNSAIFLLLGAFFSVATYSFARCLTFFSLHQTGHFIDRRCLRL